MINIVDIVKMLKESEVNAHFWHLITKSFAEHKAFEEWYTGIIDITDSLVEAWQGKNGMRLNFPSTLELTPYGDCRNYFTTMNTKLNTAIASCTTNDLDIQDILLDAKNLCNKINYLLTLS